MMIDLNASRGFSINIGGDEVVIEKIQADFEGTIQIRSPLDQATYFTAWAHEMTAPDGTRNFRNIKFMLGKQEWEFEGCSLATVSADRRDVGIHYATPKIDNRIIHG